MTKLLFVCHGNICRSPMAEYIFKKLAKEQGKEDLFFVSSAATSTEEIGNDIYPPAKRCLEAHHIPFERRHARRIIKEDLDYYDYIIVMEEYNLRNLVRMFGENPKFKMLLEKDIDDPWYSGDFETTYKEIEEGCKKWILSPKSGDLRALQPK